TSSGAATPRRSRPDPADVSDSLEDLSVEMRRARSSRDDWDDSNERPHRSGRSVPPRSARDDYGARGNPNRSGYGMPAPRSMPRGAPSDEWESARGRNGADGRGRRAPYPGGGLWGDEQFSDPAPAARGRGVPGQGGYGRGSAGGNGATPTGRGLSFGRVVGILVLALVLGIGVAFGYHVITTPKITPLPTPTNNSQPTTPPDTATPAGSPTTTATP
ncbi:MAG TPA: hypothetical protein VKQ36_04005, partial [Ktedonobacterales bacterium]|nr:hypothetical protein [Ktedonobacterales bacterium]